MSNIAGVSGFDMECITGDVLLTDDQISELNSQLSVYRDNALGYHEGELGVRARTSWEYYYGELPKPITNGSSSWVDRTVWETVNGVVQELQNVFTTTEEAVKFAPRNRKDGAAADAATKLVNKVLLADNNGYKLLGDAFKESCVTRNSFIKRYWEERKETQLIKIKDATEEEVELIVAGIEDNDGDEDFIELTIEYDEETRLGNGHISIRIPQERVQVEFVPFEQVIIEPTATSLKDLNYIAHRVRKTKTELIDMGFDKEVVEQMSPASSDIEAGVIANARINNISPLNVSDVVMVGDDRADKVWIYEEYIKTSLPTGEMELLQVFTINRQILEVNRVSEHPFETITPFPVPGYIWGESVVDITKDIQDLNSFTVRGMIDNIMNANFRRYTAIKGAYDRRSLLDNRPGGVVEIQATGAIDTLPYHPLPQGTQYLLEYVEQKKEQRTGVTRLGQGLNPDVFKNDNAFATVDTMLSQAQNRLRMICRNVAYTGMQDLMKAIYRLYRENGTKPITIDTGGRDVEINPQDLPHRDDMTVALAIGTNERKERGQVLTKLYQQALNSPVAGNINPEQHYQWTTDIMKAMGVFNAEKYITAPQDMPPPPPPSPAQQMEEQEKAEQIKLLQAQVQKLLNDVEIDQGKLQFDQAKTADEHTIRQEESLSSQHEAADKMSIEERKLVLEERKLALEAEKIKVAREKLLIEAQLEAAQDRPVALGKGPN